MTATEMRQPAVGCGSRVAGVNVVRSCGWFTGYKTCRPATVSPGKLTGEARLVGGPATASPKGPNLYYWVASGRRFGAWQLGAERLQKAEDSPRLWQAAAGACVAGVLSVW